MNMLMWRRSMIAIIRVRNRATRRRNLRPRCGLVNWTSRICLAPTRLLTGRRISLLSGTCTRPWSTTLVTFSTSSTSPTSIAMMGEKSFNLNFWKSRRSHGKRRNSRKSTANLRPRVPFVSKACRSVWLKLPSVLLNC